MAAQLAARWSAREVAIRLVPGRTDVHDRGTHLVSQGEPTAETGAHARSPADVPHLTSAAEFRADIQGLRAIAVGLVILSHMGVPWVQGGFVGVDVFFVVSGFLITGLLLREHATRSRISLRAFYARRVRRILPAATIVLIVTVVAAEALLGFVRSVAVARDAEWASVFLANLHFALDGTNYLNAQVPPSPIQHFWTLAVEEQFYLIWPPLFIALAMILPNVGLRVKLAAALVVVSVASLVWSVVQTADNGTWAFFSPLTRAWELAIGALLAVALPVAPGIRSGLASVMEWAGLVGILVAAAVFDSSTQFPGVVVALPVIATCLILAGGSARCGTVPERLLGLGPFQILGAISYSLYLWHWPILTIAAQRTGSPVPLWANALLIAVAVGLSALTYALVENPVRNSTFLRRRPVLTIAIGALLITSSFAVAAMITASHPVQIIDTPVPQ